MDGRMLRSGLVNRKIYLIGSHMIHGRVGQILPPNRLLSLFVVFSAHKLSLFAPECCVLRKTLEISEATGLFPAIVSEHSRPSALLIQGLSKHHSQEYRYRSFLDLYFACVECTIYRIHEGSTLL